ncbi:NAD(P)H-dependent oxidoreductase [Mucilaginibacter sp. KACC 22063]|uniref:NAD(P)H-dependent oxidoreductase n=1 Tax=Mucilaginibacter sp. KACC 22063 TaxID=3025666 RepID=UPI002366535E|nr:NAD(P)H-dependent oxidoreductase [Mucilaginibacter sp. KACC 22063]WDF55404.1 NAD(P)H-dependent oxidoreductase [Mucilaginibacter sp. KACC 22063]
MSLLSKLNWRYATKKFDPTKKIPADKLDELLAAVRLSPSSYGLQHYKVIVVENADVRAKLREASFGQSQITDASQVIVFAAETNIDANYVNEYINEIASVRQTSTESLAGLKDMLVNAVTNRTDEQKLVWAQKQAYIALGVLISAASELGIDACPMEGFNAQQYDEILGLKEKGVTATVIATIGYRADDDQYAALPKVRKPHEKLFIHV